MAIKYKLLAEKLRELCMQHLNQGIEKLPTEASLCQTYQVSRQTVRFALSLLEQEGLICKRQGSGSHITGRLSQAGENVIGVLLASDTHYTYPSIWEDIKDALQQQGFLPRLFITRNDTGREKQILEELLRAPLRGIIAEGCKTLLPNPNIPLYKELLKRGCKILFWEKHYPRLPEIPVLKSANAEGCQQLFAHLLQQGHNAIGCFFAIDDNQGIERYNGYTKALSEAGLHPEDSRVAWYHAADWEQLETNHDSQFIRESIRRHFQTCSAVICQNDEIAYRLIQELNKTGVSVPKDMAIASFDNSYLNTLGAQTITSLSHKPHEMGNLAAALLIRMLKGLPVDSQEVPWFTVFGSSTIKSF